MLFVGGIEFTNPPPPVLIDDRVRGAPGGGSGIYVDGASEEGDQSLDGGRIVRDHLSRAESTWAGLLGQLDAHELQRLLGHIIRQLDGLPRGLSQVPAVVEEVVETVCSRSAPVTAPSGRR